MAISTSRLRAAETHTFDLVGPDDTPLIDDDGQPCRCTVYGPGSRPYITAQAANQARLMAKLQKGRDPQLSPDERQAAQAEFLAAITVSIDLDHDGLQGRDKHLAIYSDPALGWVGDQVARHAGDWANFKPPSRAS